MRFFALAILAITAFASAPSFAQTATTSNPLAGRTYATAGYDHRQTSDINTGSLSGRVGYNFTPNFGIEGQAGIGVNEDRVLGVDVRERGNLGVFGVARAPVAERFSVIGRAGYVHTWAEAKAGSIKVRDDDGSFAIGAGAEFMVNEANGIRADYTRYTEGDGADGFAVSYVRKF